MVNSDPKRTFGYAESSALTRTRHVGLSVGTTTWNVWTSVSGRHLPRLRMVEDDAPRNGRITFHSLVSSFCRLAVITCARIPFLVTQLIYELFKLQAVMWQSV